MAMGFFACNQASDNLVVTNTADSIYQIKTGGFRKMRLDEQWVNLLVYIGTLLLSNTESNKVNVFNTLSR